MKKIIAAFICVALSLIFSGCAPQSAPAPELLTPVGSQMDTATAVVGDIEDMDIYEAAIAPEFVEMYFTHDAQIGSLLVDLGDEVSKGDKLVEIDVSAINAQLGALASEKASLEEEGEYLAALYEIDMELYELELKKLSDDAAYVISSNIKTPPMRAPNGLRR